MRLNCFKNTVLLLVFTICSCGSQTKSETVSNNKVVNQIEDNKSIAIGANRTELYLSILQGKRIAVVANQTSVIFNEIATSQTPRNDRFTHIVDSLLALEINIKKVFAPEHGFRGKADAGEVIKDGIDTKTGLPIVSLYTKNRKPTVEQLANLDMVVFDIQDVGARFYTYISSLHYIMEACAEQNIPLLILDRPNPNGHYIDGPILELEHKSFVGMHPIPVVHGMTIGEYAQMINGEKWLKNEVQCELEIILIKNYTHQTSYNLPIKPSPNLPNDIAINLYPSLCFFEGTNVSAGRGTEQQFQIFGSPFLDKKYYNYQFKTQPNQGSKYPKHENKICYGLNLSETETLNKINLEWLIEAYVATEDKTSFFIKYFTKLAGTKKLQQQIEQGYTYREIRKTWIKGLEDYKQMRKKYVLYN